MATASLQMLTGNTMELTLHDVELPEGTPLVALSGGGAFELTAIVNDGAGETDPAGVTYPLDFAFVASTASDWAVVIPAALALIAERNYFAIVDLADGTLRTGHWRIPIITKDRDAIAVL